MVGMADEASLFRPTLSGGRHRAFGHHADQIPRDRPAKGIDVTPEMIEAGVTVLEYSRGAFSEEQTVREVYIAMVRACSPLRVGK